MLMMTSRLSKNTLDASGGGANFSKELSNNLDQRVAPKYKKEGQKYFIVYLDTNKKITVLIGTSSTDSGHVTDWQMQPSIGTEYK